MSSSISITWELIINAHSLGHIRDLLDQKLGLGLRNLCLKDPSGDPDSGYSLGSTILKEELTLFAWFTQSALNRTMPIYQGDSVLGNEYTHILEIFR